MGQHSAIVKQVQGITFTGKADSNNWVMMDGPEDFGGSNGATRPKELILLALGGCTSADVIAILNKKRAKLDDFYINISAESTDIHPKVYTKINLEYVFTGEDLKEKEIERAIELSQDTYCGVTAMLQKSIEITHSYKIVDSKEFM